MKRSVYIDCSYGISGDMFVSALVHAGLPESMEVFKQYSEKLRKSFQLDAEIREVVRSGIRGFQLSVKEPEIRFKTPGDFERALDKLGLKEKVHLIAREIIRALAEAESRVHGEDTEHLHFHELGAPDTLFDAVMSAALVTELEIRYVFSSPVAVGSGTVTIAHGEVSVPAPATVELLRGMPIQGGRLKGEVTTPTGASILRALNPQFAFPDGFYLDSAGYGFGHREFEHPNYLRIMLGWVDESQLERVFEISANVDDTTPQVLAAAVSNLLSIGALDAWVECIVMKKGRPAHKLSAICYERDLEKIARYILSATTAIGLRFHPVSRWKLKRRIERFGTEFGEVSVKIIELDEGFKISAEFDECLEISERTGIPVAEVKKRIEDEVSEKLSEFKGLR